MTDATTVENIFSSLVVALDQTGMDWARAVSLATDDASSIIRKKTGVVVRFREKVHASAGTTCRRNR